MTWWSGSKELTHDLSGTWLDVGSKKGSRIEVDSDVADSFDAAEWEASMHDDISLQDVRAALSSIKGSLSEAVIASHEERF